MDTTVLERAPRSTSRVERDAIIHIRAPKKTRELIETAASIVGKTLSEFTLESARQHAIDVLLDQRLFVLELEHMMRSCTRSTIRRLRGPNSRR